MNKYRVFVSGIEIVSDKDEEMLIDKFGADFYNTISYQKHELETNGKTSIIYTDEGQQIKIVKEDRTQWMEVEEIEN